MTSDLTQDLTPDTTVQLTREEYESLRQKADKYDDLVNGNEDRLGQIFEMQKDLMLRIGVPVPLYSETHSLTDLYEWSGNMCTAIIQEAAELRDWTPWKHWSKQLGNKQQIEHGCQQHMKEMQMEIIDLFHFVLETAIIHGMTAEDIYKVYVEKNIINHERQKTGEY